MFFCLSLSHPHPILPIWHTPLSPLYDVFSLSLSLSQAAWPTGEWPAVDGEVWALVRTLREEVNKCLEQARNEKAVGASLEAKAIIHVEDASLSALLSKWCEGGVNDGVSQEGGGDGGVNGVDELRFFFMTSKVEMCFQPLPECRTPTFAMCPKFDSKTQKQGSFSLSNPISPIGGDVQGRSGGGRAIHALLPALR